MDSPMPPSDSSENDSNLPDYENSMLARSLLSGIFHCMLATVLTVIIWAMAAVRLEYGCTEKICPAQMDPT